MVSGLRSLESSQIGAGWVLTLPWSSEPHSQATSLVYKWHSFTAPSLTSKRSQVIEPSQFWSTQPHMWLCDASKFHSAHSSLEAQQIRWKDCIKAYQTQWIKIITQKAPLAPNSSVNPWTRTVVTPLWDICYNNEYKVNILNLLRGQIEGYWEIRGIGGAKDTSGGFGIGMLNIWKNYIMNIF